MNKLIPGKLYRSGVGFIGNGISIPIDAIFCLISYQNDLTMISDDDSWFEEEVMTTAVKYREEYVLYMKILYNGKVYNVNYYNPNEIAFMYFEEVKI